MTERDLRARIYGAYTSARQEALVPADVCGLESRGPYARALIRRHFPVDRDAVIVDLGCGHGALIHFARQAGYVNIHGVDRSADQVAEARRLGIGGVEEGDLLAALERLEPGSHDAVITFDVIEHLTREELLTLVDGVHRVLKPGGRWIIHTPNAESPFFGRIRYGDLTHEQAFTRTSVAQLLLSSGFRECRVYEDAPVVHGLASALRYVLWRLVRGMLAVYLAAEVGSAKGAVFSQNLLAVAVR